MTVALLFWSLSLKFPLKQHRTCFFFRICGWLGQIWSRCDKLIHSLNKVNVCVFQGEVNNNLLWGIFHIGWLILFFGLDNSGAKLSELRFLFVEEIAKFTVYTLMSKPLSAHDKSVIPLFNCCLFIDICHVLSELLSLFDYYYNIAHGVFW